MSPAPAFADPLEARVAIVGSLHLDLMVKAPRLPSLGETLPGERWWWQPGGKGGNQAVAAARHGAATSMIAKVGDDDFGVRLLDHLRQAGVDCGHVLTCDRANSGMSIATLEAGGDYAAVIVSGANQKLDRNLFRDAAAVIKQSHVLLLQQEVNDDANHQAAMLAQSSGRLVIMNAAPAKPPSKALTGLIDLLLVNAIEAKMMGEAMTVDAADIEDLGGALHAAKGLREAVTASVIVTAGGQGIACAPIDGPPFTIKAHTVDVVNSHGAGDVFAGTLAARLALGDGLQAGLIYANAAAACHVGSSEGERKRLGPIDVASRLAEDGERSN